MKAYKKSKRPKIILVLTQNSLPHSGMSRFFLIIDTYLVVFLRKTRYGTKNIVEFKFHNFSYKRHIIQHTYSLCVEKTIHLEIWKNKRVAGWRDIQMKTTTNFSFFHKKK